ncbi:hypothetical protein FOTG_18014 [Fusarium oxysporum f. sp. vasinfectum 25433]|uniref:Uncharacterized protein n=1 Tax=Fusarium oxysporum f. sp. vasinfectum 25433 TaxID=1089449 RepID=X0LYJ8_FUSOX|nr:hypothetical protein FOTG_18014 [Fusarium oxysporum f. sp. vasinfectum 25433]
MVTDAPWLMSLPSRSAFRRLSPSLPQPLAPRPQEQNPLSRRTTTPRR